MCIGDQRRGPWAKNNLYLGVGFYLYKVIVHQPNDYELVIVSTN